MRLPPTSLSARRTLWAVTPTRKRAVPLHTFTVTLTMFSSLSLALSLSLFSFVHWAHPTGRCSRDCPGKRLRKCPRKRPNRRKMCEKGRERRPSRSEVDERGNR